MDDVTHESDSDEFDPQLEALFKREHAHVPAEPFVAATLRAVAAARRRAAWKTRLVVLAAFVGVVLLSPQLIAGSVWVSSRLDELFATLSSRLATPSGAAAVALAAIAAFTARRFLMARAHAARGALTRWWSRRP
jgi:hypothetical protein